MLGRRRVCLLVVSIAFVFLFFSVSSNVTPVSVTIEHESTMKEMEFANNPPDSAIDDIPIIILVNPPVANDDTATTDEDTPVTIDVLANDYDVDYDVLSIVSVGPASHGSAAIDAGMITYTPDADFYGIDSFSYTVSDGNGGTDTATVTITVNPVDDLSVAVDDYVTTNEDTPIIVNVLANDYDVEGDYVMFELVGWSPPQPHGSLDVVYVNGVKMIKYTPGSNWHGNAWFTYTLYQIEGIYWYYQDRGIVYVTVKSVPDAPTAVDDFYSVDEDTVLQVGDIAGVMANDFDGDGDAFTIQLLSGPSHGTLIFNTDGSFTYTPDLNWYGSDSFVYKASDGTLTDTATVTITVNPVDDLSVAVDDYVTTNEDTPIIVNVLANDYDVEGDYVMFELVGWSPPQPHGSLDVVYVNGVKMIKYTPGSNWHGNAWFTYTLYQIEGIYWYYQDRGIVYVTVESVPDAPVALDDEYETNEDVPLTVLAPGFLMNDTDADGDTLVVDLLTVTGLTYGSLGINPDGSFTWTSHESDWYGTETFSYQAYDGTDHSNIATVTITVLPVPDIPVAVDDFYATNEDTILVVPSAYFTGILENDDDADGDSLMIILDTEPTLGSLTLSADGAFTYVPYPDLYGTDTFTYHVSDDLSDSNVATVTITVESINDAPVALDDEYETNEDVPLSLPAPGFLGNDKDVDGDTFVVDLYTITGLKYGSLGINPDGSFTWTSHESDWYGTETFSYQVYDGFELSNIATVTITVNPVDDLSVAVDDYVTTNEDTPIIVNVLANDYDVEGDSFMFYGYGYGPPQPHGSLALVYVDGVKMIKYTPNPNWHGSAWFTYSIYKSVGSMMYLQDSAYVYIAVNSVNDAPVADAGGPYITDEGVQITFDASGSTDIEGDSLEYRWDFGDGSTGTGKNPTHIYVDGGIYTVTLTVTDNDGGVGTDTLTVTVNDAPVAVDDAYSTNEDTVLQVDATTGVLVNDTDLEGDLLIAQLVSGPSHGSLVFNADGSFTYTPDLNWYGSDSFVYEASDGTLTDTATVTITVNPVDDPSVAVDDYVVTDEDTPIIIDVLANDYDVEGDPFVLPTGYGVRPPQPYGQLSVVTVDGIRMFRYSPNPNWHGSAWFDYGIYKVVGPLSTLQSIARVYITVNPVNDAPVANDDTATTDEDVPITIDVLANDSDADGDSLTIDSVGLASSGTAVINAGMITYTPAADFNGVDSFSYTISDGNGGTDTATVTITVNPVNDAPVADAGGPYITDEGAQMTFDASDSTDIDGDQLQFEWDFGDDSTGTGMTPTHIYADDGIYTVTLTVTDDDGGINSDTLTVTVNNVAPTADAGPDQTVDEDSTVNFAGVFTDPGWLDSWTFEWDFGDGSPAVTGTVNEQLTLLTSYVYVYPGVYTVTLTVTDDDGGVGTDSLVVEVEDITPPETTLTLLGDFLEISKDEFYISSTATQIQLEAEDPEWFPELPYGSSGVALIKYQIDSTGWVTYTEPFTVAVIGTHTIYYRSIDYAGNVETAKWIEVVVNAAELTYLGEFCGVYSDPAYLEARLIDITTQLPIAGKLIHFKVGNQLGSWHTNSTGYASVTIILNQPSGTYPVWAWFDGDGEYLASESDTHDFTIEKETAYVEYTGSTVVPTTVMTITLRATVFDDDDGTWGDLTKVFVTFEIFTMPLGGLDLIQTHGPYQIEATVIAGVGVFEIPILNLDEDCYTIRISLDPEVNAYYQSAPSDDVIITVYEPTGDFVTGGGWIWDSDGNRGNFGFNVKYKKNGLPKGQFVYIYRTGEYKYRIKATAWLGMAIIEDHSFFEAKCVVEQYDAETDVLIWSEGNYKIRVDVWDNAEEEGLEDVLQIRVYDKIGLLWYEAGFDPYGFLQGGNIVIHIDKEK